LRGRIGSGSSGTKTNFDSAGWVEEIKRADATSIEEGDRVRVAVRVGEKTTTVEGIVFKPQEDGSFQVMLGEPVVVEREKLGVLNIHRQGAGYIHKETGSTVNYPAVVTEIPKMAPSPDTPACAPVQSRTCP